MTADSRAMGTEVDTDYRWWRLPHCHRCGHAIGDFAKKEDEPMICGTCHHDIAEEGGRRAVRAYCDAMRAERPPK